MTNDELNPNDEIPQQHPAQIGRRLRVGHSVFVIPSAFVIPVSSFGSQANRMPGVKTARWPVNGLPARRPFAGVMIVRGRVESQPCNNREGVTVARVDGDPFARTARTVAAKLS
jgi:hypothetical protein